METDSFFCQLLKQLPETLFELLGLPPARAAAYQFNSVEVKKSFRIDGLFAPKKAGLPVYFVEVQFQRQAKFYANLFAKVFWYLAASAIRAAILETSPRIGQSFSTRRTLPSSSTTWRSSGATLRQ